MRVPPAAATVLGFAGLLPPLLTIAGQLFARSNADPAIGALAAAGVALFGLSYIGLILSFLGGMWWGASAGKVSPSRLWGWLSLSVTPSLVAYGAANLVWLPPVARVQVTAAVLLVALLLTLAGDRLLVRARLVPDWWMSLRVPLSVLLAAEALAIALLA